MADPSTRDAKLIQYLNEAYGKEKELETALQAHIGMTTRAPYRKRLQDHLKETKAQARGLERRIKALGGKATPVTTPGPDVLTDAAGTVTSAANKAVALARGPLHAVRGTGEAEKMLKNAKTEYWNEAEEIATYIGLESLATSVNDGETAKMAKEFRRQEERMRNFLERLIPTLTKAVAQEEIPASERRSGKTRGRRTAARRGGRATSRSTSRSATASTRSGGRSSGGSARSGGRSSGGSTRSGGRSSSGATGSSGRSSGGSTRSGGRSSGGSTRSGGRSGGRSAGAGGSSRSTGGRSASGSRKSGAGSAGRRSSGSTSRRARRSSS